MSLHLLIDGYNLLFSSALVEGSGELEGLRKALLQKLERYQAARGHRLTVVFDGARQWPDSMETTYGGPLGVVFSDHGETADGAIQVLLTETSSETVVVTSDRALQRSASGQGAGVVSVEEFASKVRQTLASSVTEEEDEESDEGPTLSTRKRGNPRRAKRRDRRRSTWFKKL